LAGYELLEVVEDGEAGYGLTGNELTGYGLLKVVEYG
jgi:hypothetical protein